MAVGCEALGDLGRVTDPSLRRSGVVSLGDHYGDDASGTSARIRPRPQSSRRGLAATETRRTAQLLLCESGGPGERTPSGDRAVTSSGEFDPIVFRRNWFGS